ncbi:hypothetical protein NC652_038904 [Populus alba x Populus x berolinensis]|nr:hypothetical protein NC652_038898 [Populus alba x Populus x berolinensis]KAJ6861917.1 hypothetical protein NC652_038904 [Populus alba x Populus x berolinensis]
MMKNKKLSSWQPALAYSYIRWRFNEKIQVGNLDEGIAGHGGCCSCFSMLGWPWWMLRLLEDAWVAMVAFRMRMLINLEILTRALLAMVDAAAASACLGGHGGCCGCLRMLGGGHGGV